MSMLLKYVFKLKSVSGIFFMKGVGELKRKKVNFVTQFIALIGMGLMTYSQFINNEIELGILFLVLTVILFIMIAINFNSVKKKKEI